MFSPVEKEIRTRIARNGMMTFAEYMEVVLYHPNIGYYTGGTDVSHQKDYFTSPSAHPAFGALITILLWKMWDVLSRPEVFHVIEIGAGDGLLARDILLYSSELPAQFASALHYVALDRSANRMNSYEGSLQCDKVVSDSVPLKGLVGCILSNELVDSFPVHRFEVQDGEIKEIFVTVVDDKIAEHLDVPCYPNTKRVKESLGSGIWGKGRMEINAGIPSWLAQANGSLERGFVLTVDYGYESIKRQYERSRQGTVQTYYQHSQGSSPYDLVGFQDITAHVDFSSIVLEGALLGLAPVVMLTQRELLQLLGLDVWIRRLRSMDISDGSRQSNTMAMRELVRVDGLGGFKVLVQEKATHLDTVTQLALDRVQSEPSLEANEFPVPLLRSEHLQLIRGRYPDAIPTIDLRWPWMTT